MKFEYIYFNIETNETKNDIIFLEKMYDKKVKNKIKNNYAGYLFTNISDRFKKYEFSFFPNIVSRQSTAMYLNYILKNIVRYATKNEKLEVEIINEPLPYTYKEKNDKQERYKIVIIFFISISFSLIPANFITIIIKERENNSKHLQIISVFHYLVIGSIIIYLK